MSSPHAPEMVAPQVSPEEAEFAPSQNKPVQQEEAKLVSMQVVKPKQPLTAELKVAIGLNVLPLLFVILTLVAVVFGLSFADSMFSSMTGEDAAADEAAGLGGFALAVISIVVAIIASTVGFLLTMVLTIAYATRNKLIAYLSSALGVVTTAFAAGLVISGFID